MLKFKNFIKENKLLCLFFVFFIITMLIYDDNSFLFKYTVMHDEGVYWNIAKEMFKGKVPYLNIYDHKGPFIFFIYQLLYLISIPGTTSGVFIYDFICISISFYFIYKTNALFHNKTENLIILFLVYIFFVNTWFRYGGVPEFIVMTLYSYLIYWLFSKKYKKCNLKSLYFITIISGIVFWLKFNLLIVPGILFLFYFVTVIIREKQYKNLIHCFIGFMIPTIIVFGYFLRNNALENLIHCYFLDNLGYKADIVSSTFANFIIFISLSLIIFILNFLSLKRFKILKKEFCIFYLCFCFLIFCQFVLSNRFYLYYFYPCIPFFSVMLFSLKRLDKYTISIIIVIISFFIMINSPIFIEENNHKIIFSTDDNAVNDLKNILKKGDNVFSFKVSPSILNQFDEVINDYYFYFPNNSYEQNPDLWNTILDNIKYKKYDYIISQKELFYLENEVINQFVVSYDSYAECNLDILSEIFKYLEVNYEEVYISDFSSHVEGREVVLLKKK